MADDRLKVNFNVKNEEGKETVGVTLGEMKLVDTLKLEIKMLEVLIADAKAQLAALEAE